MTDIVERLRDGTYCTVGCAKLRGDAAAEVERLRAALGPSAAEAWAHMYDESVRLQADNERLRAAIMSLRDAYDTAETEVVRLRTAMHDIAIGGNGDRNWTLDEVRSVAWDALDVAPDVAPAPDPKTKT